MSDEALKTSAIEGEVLDRASVQSSLQRQFGPPGSTMRVKAAEWGICPRCDHGTRYALNLPASGQQPSLAH